MIRKVDEAHEQPPWSRFHTAGALTPLVCCLIVALLCVYPVFSSEADPVRVFEVRIDDQGLAQVHAVVELPARSDTVFAVLTDYARWPSLFSEGLTIASIRDDQDGVITDMYLPRILMPGTLHLVIRTRAPTRDRIEAELITGDLNRFWRLWHLTPLDGGRQTRADLQMTVQPKGGLPNGSYAMGSNGSSRITLSDFGPPSKPGNGSECLRKKSTLWIEPSFASMDLILAP